MVLRHTYLRFALAVRKTGGGGFHAVAHQATKHAHIMYLCTGLFMVHLVQCTWAVYQVDGSRGKKWPHWLMKFSQRLSSVPLTDSIMIKKRIFLFLSKKLFHSTTFILYRCYGKQVMSTRSNFLWNVVRKAPLKKKYVIRFSAHAVHRRVMRRPPPHAIFCTPSHNDWAMDSSKRKPRLRGIKHW